MRYVKDAAVAITAVYMVLFLTSTDAYQSYSYRGTFENTAYVSPFTPVSSYRESLAKAERRGTTLGKRSDQTIGGCVMQSRPENGGTMYTPQDKLQCHMDAILRGIIGQDKSRELTNGFLSSGILKIESIFRKSGRLQVKVFSPDPYNAVDNHMPLNEFKATLSYDENDSVGTSVELQAEGSFQALSSQVTIKREKDSSEYSYTFNGLSNVPVLTLLSEFGLNEDFISKSRMGNFFSQDLTFTGAELAGLSVPGQAFEFVLSGHWQSGKEGFLVVQSYVGELGPKYGLYLINANPSESELPSVVAHALYKLKPVGGFAITAASSDIVASSNTQFNDKTAPFVSSNSLYAIRQGLHITYKKTALAIKAKDEVKSLVMLVKILQDKYEITSPDPIADRIRQVFEEFIADPSGNDPCEQLFTREGVFDNLIISPTLGSYEIVANITEDDQVIPGILSLSGFQAFLIKNDERRQAGARSNGKILGKPAVVFTPYDEMPFRCTFTGDLEFNSIEQILNETKASFLTPSFTGPGFQRLLHFTISNVKMNFILPQRSQKTHLEIEAKVEIFDKELFKSEMTMQLFEENGELRSILGLKFYKLRTDEVLNLLYDETIVKETLLPFEEIKILLHNVEKEPSEDQIGSSFFNSLDYPYVRYNSFSQIKGKGFIVVFDVLDFDQCGEKHPFCRFHLMNDLGGVVTLEGSLSPEEVTLMWSPQPYVACNNNFRIQEASMLANYTSQKEHASVKIAYCTQYSATVLPPIDLKQEGSMIRMIVEKNRGKTAWNSFFEEAFSFRGFAMHKINLNTHIDPGRQLKELVFESELAIGTVRNKRVKIKSNTRQFINLRDKTKSYFYGVTNSLALTRILEAFGIEEDDTLLDLRFRGQTSFLGKNGKDAIFVPEYNIANKKKRSGMWITGKYKQEKSFYDLEVQVGTSQVKVSIDMPVISIDGERLMIRQKKSSLNGPTLVYVFKSGESPNVKLQGFVESIGMEQDATIQMAKTPVGSSFNRTFNFQIREKLNDKVQATTSFTLTGDWSVKDLSTFHASIVMELDRRAIQRDIPNALSREWDRAKAKAAVSFERAQAHKQMAQETIQQYHNLLQNTESEMKRHEIEALKKGQDINDLKEEISTDCVDRCKYIRLPSVDLKDGGMINGKKLKVLRWQDKKDAYKDPACISRCEAKKLSSAKASKEQIAEARGIIESYRRSAVELSSMAAFAEVLDKLRSLSRDMDRYIDTLNPMNHREHGITVTSVYIRDSLNHVKQACPEFTVEFGSSLTSSICINDDFYKELARRILGSKFEWLRQIRNIGTELKMKRTEIYAARNKLEDLKQSLLTKEEGEENQAGREHLEVGNKRLLKVAEPQMPRPVIKSDKTTMAMTANAPWRSKRAKAKLPHAVITSYGAENLAAAFPAHPCRRGRSIITGMHDIVKPYHGVVRSYTEGKQIISNVGERIARELKDTEKDIASKASKFKMSDEQRNDMNYWLNVTKSGYASYMEDSHVQLSAFNMEGHDAMTDAINAAFMHGPFGSAFSYVNKLSRMGADLERRSGIATMPSSMHFAFLKRVSRSLMKIIGSRGLTVEQTVAEIETMDQGLSRLKVMLPVCA